MKFWAKANVEKESAKKLILAFFGEEFNNESSIAIKGKQAQLEVVFESPPLKILEELTNCEDYDFTYGKSWEEFDRDEITGREKEPVEEDGDSGQEEEPTEEDGDSGEKKEPAAEEGNLGMREEPVAEERNPELEETPVAEEEEPVAEEGNPEQGEAPVGEEIPEITEIAKKSTSYEEFIRSIAEWIEPNKEESQLFIIKLIKAATQVDVINWKNIEKIFDEEGFEYKPSVRTAVSNSVTKKFKEIRKDVTILNSLKLLVRYQNFVFDKGAIVEEDISKKRVRMECMPEIPWFEELLGSIDKSQPVETRVNCVLEAMGLKDQDSKDRDIITAVANTAVTTNGSDLNSIYEKIGKQWNKTKGFVQLTISTFVNKFVELNSDSKEKIVVSQFIRDFREAVMLKSEIEDFT